MLDIRTTKIGGAPVLPSELFSSPFTVSGGLVLTLRQIIVTQNKYPSVFFIFVFVEGEFAALVVCCMVQTPVVDLLDEID